MARQNKSYQDIQKLHDTWVGKSIPPKVDSQAEMDVVPKMGIKPQSQFKRETRSQKTHFVMRPSLYQAMKRCAFERNMSLNDIADAAISKYLGLAHMDYLAASQDAKKEGEEK